MDADFVDDVEEVLHPIPEVGDVQNLKVSLGEVRGHDTIISKAARRLHAGAKLVWPLCPCSVGY